MSGPRRHARGGARAPRLRAAGLLAGLCAGLAAPPATRPRAARAAEARAAPAVALVREEGAPLAELELRVRSELRAVGFAPEPWPAVAAAEVAERLAAAPASGPAAVVRLGGAAGGPVVEIWVRTAGRAIARRTLGPAPGATADLLALRAVEQVRALGIGPAIEARAPMAAPAAAPRWSLGLGGGASFGPGGLAPGAAGVAHARVGLGAGTPWSLGLVLALPLSSPGVSGAEGRAEVDPHLAGLDLGWEGPARARLRARLGGGVALAALVARATAREAYVARERRYVSALPFARLGVVGAIAGRLRASADLLVGAALPRPIVAFAGREVAAWGRPVLLGTIGLEYDGGGP